MKLMLALLVTTALGFGGYRAATAADPLAPAVAAEDCKISVKCLPDGKCQIKCEAPDGKICVKEIECDGDECAAKSCTGTPCPPAACK